MPRTGIDDLQFLATASADDVAIFVQEMTHGAPPDEMPTDAQLLEWVAVLDRREDRHDHQDSIVALLEYRSTLERWTRLRATSPR